MIVLVTGGAGYIGSHVCKALKEGGFSPIVYDSFSQGDPSFVKWGPFLRGDVCDQNQLEEAFWRHKPQAVIHLAGNINVRESLHNPGKYYQNNIDGTLALLEVMSRHEVDKLIFASSSAVYSSPVSLSIDEEHPKKPLHPYGKSKLMCEEILEDYKRCYGLRYVALRYFNAAGADSDGEIGEAHTPETHLIPLAILAALKPENPLTVYGDGSVVRDYVHVSDIADAHLKALSFLEMHEESAAINIGSGKGHSVLDVIKAVEARSGRKLERVAAPASLDSPTLVANISRAKTLLGFEPKHSDLQNIIETAWRWHEKLPS